MLVVLLRWIERDVVTFPSLQAVEPMPGLDPDRIRRALEADNKDDGGAAEVDFR